MKFTVLTLFPDAFPGTLGLSVAGNSLNKDWFLNVVDIRKYGIGKWQNVDDEVYGGGSGMLMRADVLSMALEDCVTGNDIILATSPRGVMYSQKIANSLSLSGKNIIIICGRFEGIDFRLVEKYNILEVSIGNFVLFGGEVASMCIMESIVRLREGVCGNFSSVDEESFSVGSDFESLMEYPHYTRPPEWEGLEVPSVLRSGHHGKIKKWRLKQAKRWTKFYKKAQSKIDNLEF